MLVRSGRARLTNKLLLLVATLLIGGRRLCPTTFCGVLTDDDPSHTLPPTLKEGAWRMRDAELSACCIASCSTSASWHRFRPSSVAGSGIARSSATATISFQLLELRRLGQGVHANEGTLAAVVSAVEPEVARPLDPPRAGLRPPMHRRSPLQSPRRSIRPRGHNPPRWSNQSK